MDGLDGGDFGWYKFYGFIHLLMFLFVKFALKGWRSFHVDCFLLDACCGVYCGLPVLAVFILVSSGELGVVWKLRYG